MNPNPISIPDDDQRFLHQFEMMKNEEAAQWATQKTEEFFRLMSYYRCAIMEIETKLNVLNEEHRLLHDRNPINSIQSRLKTPGSIRSKLARKGLPMTRQSIEENLNDVAGLRVVCSFPADIFTIADALLSQDDILLIEKKDYIAHPKENGYRSLHLILAVPIFLTNEKRMMKVEVQLRTIAMDCWASLEHQLRYKKQLAFPDHIAHELAVCAELSAQLDRRMNSLMQQLSSNNPTTT